MPVAVTVQEEMELAVIARALTKTVTKWLSYQLHLHFTIARLRAFITTMVMTVAVEVSQSVSFWSTSIKDYPVFNKNRKKSFRRDAMSPSL